jgi:anthranilate phosphoribosyltransferase
MNSNISSITLTGAKKEKQAARELIASGYDPRNLSPLQKRLLWESLPKISMPMISRNLGHRKDLNFEEAFCGMCYVIAATNLAFRKEYGPVIEKALGARFTHERAVAMASAFLSNMASKESNSHLTPVEVAGLVAAGMMDCVYNIYLPRAIETCGMGGDKGYGSGDDRKKGINVSTLSSLVLSALGLPSVKHGSYGNTSKVGSTEAIELFGAITSMTSLEQVEAIVRDGCYCYFDAHECKSLHDISHLLMAETINHVIGPMTPPLSCKTEITKVMGVNEKMSAKTIVLAYNELHVKKIQSMGGIVVIAGLGTGAEGINPLDEDLVRKHTIVDELSPYASVVSIGYGSKYLGTFVVKPEDFGISIDPNAIQFENDLNVIHQANIDALSGANKVLVDYLAMNSALGVFAFEDVEKNDAIIDGRLNRQLLRSAFERCRQAIISGKAMEVLENYVKKTGGEFVLTPA